jgi:hypothetical protein
MSDKLQIFNHLSNVDMLLLDEGDSNKVFSGSLAPSADAQHILILRNEDAAKSGGPVDQRIIIEFGPSVFKSRDNINSALAKPARDLAAHLMIHIKGQH